MKLYKLISIIIIIFLKTGNVLSENNIFDVNNIEIELQGKVSQQASSNKAIREGFNRLVDRILLEDDNKKLSDLKFSEIKELVNYYQVEDKLDIKSNNETIFKIDGHWNEYGHELVGKTLIVHLKKNYLIKK